MWESKMNSPEVERRVVEIRFGNTVENYPVFLWFSIGDKDETVRVSELNHVVFQAYKTQRKPYTKSTTR